MSSPCLIALANTFARPRLACFKSSRGTLGYNMPMLFYRLLLSYLKTNINISLHAREAVIILATAE